MCCGVQTSRFKHLNLSSLTECLLFAGLSCRCPRKLHILTELTLLLGRHSASKVDRSGQKLGTVDYRNTGQKVKRGSWTSGQVLWSSGEVREDVTRW